MRRLQQANQSLYQEQHLHEWLCHAPDVRWVKRGRNLQHTDISQLFLVYWSNPMSSLRNCSSYRMYTGIIY